ncbi:MAG TPA: DUF2834 domain-containing protein [Terriglobales bacterium]|nr:DUF2834 domain-containing protein [Terriglobales bacterium]
MKPKILFLALCFVGAILPYWEFVPWVLQHGLNLRLLIQELFASRISAFFGLDVIISAVALLAFIRIESRRQGIKMWWLPYVAVLSVGVSLGLPLFLYMRELRIEQSGSMRSSAGL